MDYIRGEVNTTSTKREDSPPPPGSSSSPPRSSKRWDMIPCPSSGTAGEPGEHPEFIQEYPYILITGARQPGFFHTENRQVPWLRELHPDPIVEIHPDTAAKEGIQEGDWVIIESRRGKVRQRAKLALGVIPGSSPASTPGGFRKKESGSWLG